MFILNFLTPAFPSFPSGHGAPKRSAWVPVIKPKPSGTFSSTIRLQSKIEPTKCKVGSERGHHGHLPTTQRWNPEEEPSARLRAHSEGGKWHIWRRVQGRVFWLHTASQQAGYRDWALTLTSVASLGCFASIYTNSWLTASPQYNQIFCCVGHMTVVTSYLLIDRTKFSFIIYNWTTFFMYITFFKLYVYFRIRPPML